MIEFWEDPSFDTRKQNIHTLTQSQTITYTHETCRNFDLGKIRFSSPFFQPYLRHLFFFFFSFQSLSLSQSTCTCSFILLLILLLSLRWFFGLGFQHMKQIDCKIGVLQNWFSNFLCCIALRFVLLVVVGCMCLCLCVWFFCSFEMITFFVLYIWNRRIPIPEKKDKKKLKAAISWTRSKYRLHIQYFSGSLTFQLSTWNSGASFFSLSNSNIFSSFSLCYWE